MAILVALLASAFVLLIFWAIWPVLRDDMVRTVDRGLDMTTLSIMALGAILFVGGMTALTVLA